VYCINKVARRLKKKKRKKKPLFEEWPHLSRNTELYYSEE
jgi:hypothetical protein